MLDDRSYMRENTHRSPWSATVILTIAVVVCFVLQTIASAYWGKSFWIREHLALSVDGLKNGFIWQLLTFQFLHGGFLHLAGNLIVIWFFGRSVEDRLGPRELLKLYFLSGTAGGALQAALGALMPAFGAATVGASAGALGLLAAFALIEPNAVICFMFFIRMPAKVLLWIELGVATVFTFAPSSSPGIAHAAHLGGILAAIAYMRWDVVRPSINWNPWQGRKRKRQLVQAAAQVAGRRGKRNQPSAELPPEEFISKEVDPILDKISAHGIHSLTPRERQILEAARAKMAKG